MANQYVIEGQGVRTRVKADSPENALWVYVQHCVENNIPVAEDARIVAQVVGSPMNALPDEEVEA